MAQQSGLPGFTRFVGWLEGKIGAMPVLGFLIRLVGRNWWRFSDLRRLLWACRAQLLSVAVGGALIALTDQARDIVIASSVAKGGLGNKIGLVATMLLWASVSWYWARVTLNFSFALLPLDADKAAWNRLTTAQQKQRSDFREFWRLQVPRVIGAASMVLVSAAYCKAGRVYKAAGSGNTNIFFYWSAGFLALAVAFYIAVACRTRILAWLLQRPPGWYVGRTGTVSPSKRVAQVLVPQRLVYDRLRDYANPVAIFFMAGSLVMAPILSSLFISHPVGMSEHFGDAVRVVLCGLAVMVPIMSLLALVSQSYRVPIFGLIIFWIVISPQLTRDNHNVRTIAETLTAQQIAARVKAQQACGSEAVRKAALGPVFRPTVDEVFNKWLTANQAWAKPVPTTGGNDVLVSPFIVVATAGGASRAAFWTSQVLSEIAAREPHFTDQLFLISGVSGGSLGAVTFRSLIEANRRQTPASPTLQDFAEKARGFLEHDFLTPAMAVGLYVDLPFNALSFLPQSVLPADRAVALEKAWEGFASGYVDLPGSKGFSWSNGFLETFGGERPWPILALNGTSVEKGKRIVFSNADFACTNLSGPITRYDGVAVLGADVPISTAATMSARFPVISPTGGMVNSAEMLQMRVTDGGLFENFGAVTAEEVLRHIVERRRDVQEGRVQVAPLAILISSDPSLDVLDSVTNTGRVRDFATGASRNLASPDCDKGESTIAAAGNGWPECPLHPLKTATSLLDPALALYDGRTARGEMAAVSLMDRIAGSALLVRDRLAQALVKASPSTDPAKAAEKALTDAGNFLGTRNHVDFFHFRQCRVAGLKSPTMSWHDSDEAWEAMLAMTGLGPRGDVCGNAAEFFRLCTRLARLSGSAADDVAASDYCDKKTNPKGPGWERPRDWACIVDGSNPTGARMCGIYK